MIWIVSPMLNDTTAYTQLHREVREALANVGAPAARFLVVDDSAGTDPEVASLAAFDDIEVLTPPFNLGHQRGIVYGLRHLAPDLADDDVVITMDSDGEDQPSDVPRLLQALESPGAVLVLAERTKRSEPLSFRALYVVFRLFFRLLTGTTVLSGNFAGQRAASLKATINHPSFDLCYSSTLLALRRPTATVPCARGSRFAGQSRMNTHSLIGHGIRMLLPFLERIAARMLVMTAVALVAFAAVLITGATGALAVAPGTVGFALTAFTGSMFVATFVGFLVLFAGFGSVAKQK